MRIRLNFGENFGDAIYFVKLINKWYKSISQPFPHAEYMVLGTDMIVHYNR